MLLVEQWLLQETENIMETGKTDRERIQRRRRGKKPVSTSHLPNANLDFQQGHLSMCKVVVSMVMTWHVI